MSRKASGSGALNNASKENTTFNSSIRSFDKAGHAIWPCLLGYQNIARHDKTYVRAPIFFGQIRGIFRITRS